MKHSIKLEMLEAMARRHARRGVPFPKPLPANAPGLPATTKSLPSRPSGCSN